MKETKDCVPLKSGVVTRVQAYNVLLCVLLRIKLENNVNNLRVKEARGIHRVFGMTRRHLGALHSREFSHAVIEMLFCLLITKKEY